jgi:hypothetical protein
MPGCNLWVLPPSRTCTATRYVHGTALITDDYALGVYATRDGR